jgi:hypothetical protein
MSDKTCGTIKVEQRNVADLIPFARNSRTHSGEQAVHTETGKTFAQMATREPVNG